MSIANQVQATVIYGAETTFGTAPAQGLVTAKTLRRVSSSLSPNKDVYQSAEARPDLQLADMRHGTIKPGGAIQAELANVAFDDLLQAVLRGTWAAGTSILAATYTTLAFAITSGTAGAPGSLGTITMAAGDPVAAGVRTGDIIRAVGAGFAPNNTTNFRVVSFGGTTNRTITVTPAPATLAATAGTSLSVQGNKLLPGTVSRSFTLEQKFPDIGISELYTGMRVGGCQINLPPGGMATCSFTFLGQGQQVLDGGTTPPSPYFTAAVASGTNSIFAGPQGTLRAGGVEQGIVTALSCNIELNLQAPPVVGSVLVPDIFYGPTHISGSVSAFLQDKTLINQFLNENEIDIVAMLSAAMAAPADFLCFNMQRVKLGGATKTVAAQGGVVATFPYTALLASTVQTGAGADAAAISIQRSN